MRSRYSTPMCIHASPITSSRYRVLPRLAPYARPSCGDGIVTAGEECDNGAANNDTLYGGCTTQCKFGPVLRRRHRQRNRNNAMMVRTPPSLRAQQRQRLRHRDANIHLGAATASFRPAKTATTAIATPMLNAVAAVRPARSILTAATALSMTAIPAWLATVRIAASNAMTV